MGRRREEKSIPCDLQNEMRQVKSKESQWLHEGPTGLLLCKASQCDAIDASHDATNDDVDDDDAVNVVD